MIITQQNVGQLLDDCNNALLIAIHKLQHIEKDTPATHDEIEMINGEVVHVAEPLPMLIEFIAKHKPDPALIGDRLSNAIKYLAEFLKEKIRILNDTPQVFKDTNEMTGMN